MGNASSLSPERIALVQGALGYLAFGECVVALRIFPDGAFLAPAKPFWQWMVERLAAERCLRTVGPDRFELLGVNGWRGCFERLWQSRHGVVASPALDGGPRGAWRTMRCVVRVRPAAGAAAAAADRPPPEVTVPLHQRVALLRRRGLSAADAKAKAVAMKKGGLRATICGHDDARVHALAPYVGAKTYDFDRVLGAAATQEDVWKLAFPVVHDALNGRDGCVFATRASSRARSASSSTPRRGAGPSSRPTSRSSATTSRTCSRAPGSGASAALKPRGSPEPRPSTPSSRRAPRGSAPRRRC